MPGGADQGERRGDQAVEAALEHLVDRVDVGGLARDDATRGVALVEGRAQHLEVPEHPAPDLVERRPARCGPAGRGSGCGPAPGRGSRRARTATIVSSGSRSLLAWIGGMPVSIPSLTRNGMDSRAAFSTRTMPTISCSIRLYGVSRSRRSRREPDAGEAGGQPFGRLGRLLLVDLRLAAPGGLAGVRAHAPTPSVRRSRSSSSASPDSRSAYAGTVASSSRCSPTWVMVPSWMQGHPVGEEDRRGTVGHDEPGGAAEDPAQRLLDELLGVHVERGEGVVEDEDPWLGEDGPGQRETLPLAAREGVPLLADAGVEPPRQVADEAGLGDVEGLVDLGVGGVDAAEGEVLPGAAVLSDRRARTVGKPPLDRRARLWRDHRGDCRPAGRNRSPLCPSRLRRCGAERRSRACRADA